MSLITQKILFVILYGPGNAYSANSCDLICTYMALAEGCNCHTFLHKHGNNNVIGGIYV